jgi:hypothetical protein
MILLISASQVLGYRHEPWAPGLSRVVNQSNNGLIIIILLFRDKAIGSNIRATSSEIENLKKDVI